MPPPPEPPGVMIRRQIQESRRTRYGIVLRTGPEDLDLYQCSRSSPDRVEGYWVPSDLQIAELEERLPAFLESLPVVVQPRPLDSYFLQYTGFRKGGREWIEVNAITPLQGMGDRPDAFLDLTAQPPLYEPWLSERVWVCDGQNNFWGVVYDPSTRTFTNYAMNGGA